MRKKIKIIIAFLIFVTPLLSVEAATLSVSPSSGSYAVGETFSVDIRVSSLDMAINSVAGYISFPRNSLSVESVSKEGSILTIWAKEPSFVQNGCLVKFEGTLLDPGFIGDAGKLISVNFKVKGPGTTRLNTSTSRILANDGYGTDVFEASNSVVFNLLDEYGDFSLIATSAFPDIVDHWFEEEVNVMNRACIIEGNVDGYFYPDNNITRAQTAILLCRIMHDDSIADEMPFSDVKLDNWYGSCVSDLKDYKIVGGYGDGTYKPDNPITRAEFLAIAMRGYEKIFGAIDEAIAPQADYYDLKTDWYTLIVNSATEMGFVEGLQCGRRKCFYANNNITRAEAVSILYKMFETTF